MLCDDGATDDGNARDTLYSADAAANANADAVLMYASMLSQLWLMLLMLWGCCDVLCNAILSYAMLMVMRHIYHAKL